VASFGPWGVSLVPSTRKDAYFGHRDDRIDLNGVLRVTGLKLNEDSRNYALVSTRVQANVDSPSRSSRRARKPRS